MEKLQIAIDLLEGKITVDEFMSKTKESTVLESLQDLVPEGMTRYVQKTVGNEIFGEEVPYNVKELLGELYSVATIDAKVNIFAEIRDILLPKYPDIKIDNTLIDKFRFILINTPAYIGGIGAEKVLEKIYDHMDIANIKNYKDAIKQAFRVSKKPPKWIQAPEWPVDEKGRPLQFLYERQISKEEKEYFFQQIESKCVISIKQSA